MEQLPRQKLRKPSRRRQPQPQRKRQPQRPRPILVLYGNAFFAITLGIVTFLPGLYPEL